MEKNFFYENDVRVTKIAVKAMRWLILVFPLLILLSIVGIFQSKMEHLIPITLVGLGQAHKIVEESETQKNVTGEVEVSFHQVNRVSGNLQNIGK